MLLKIKSLEKEIYYRTTLNFQQLNDIEYELKNIDFEDIFFYFEKKDYFLKEDNTQNNYDYIISLIDQEYAYFLEKHPASLKTIDTLNKLITKRIELTNAILEMFDCCDSIQPIKIANYIIKPWSYSNASFVNYTKENIILFYSLIIGKRESLL